MAYRPIQPITTINPTGVFYQEYLPAQRLNQQVYCYWELYSTELLESSYTYVTVADGCVDILIDCLNELSIAHLIGPTAEHSLYELTRPFHYRGIRFLPGGFTAAFHIPAYEIKNQFLALADVLPQFQEALGQSHFSSDQWSWPKKLNALLNQRLYDIAIDARVSSILKELITPSGTKHNSSSIYLSPRQIQRIFKEHVGLPVKTLSRIIRLQQWLQDTQNKKIPHYYDLGYYDQAHFIKDCKKLSGFSPKEWTR